MAFGTRPALARVRVSGASTTRLGKRHSPTARGSSKVGIEFHHFPKSSRRTRRAGLRQIEVPGGSRLSRVYRRSRPDLTRNFGRLSLSQLVDGVVEHPPHDAAVLVLDVIPDLHAPRRLHVGDLK